MVALLAAMTCQGTVAAESPENLPVHSYPPLPVARDNGFASDRTAPPRQNPYFVVPPAEGLVTLTGGETPEPTLLRPMSSKLTLVPVERDEQPSAEDASSSTIQLGQTKTNAFAHQAATLSRSQDKPPTASQASFDRDEQISEADGAVTFSFSDANEPSTKPPQSEPSPASDGKGTDEPAVVEGSSAKPEPTQTKNRPTPSMASALQPEEVREASPVQLAPLTVDDDAKSSPVVVSSQRRSAAKQDSSNGTAPGEAKTAASSDDALRVPALLRPVEQIIVADDSNQP
ncbi:MAG: hypothetical protein WD119_02075, partial [Pirellulaceae bacterium]